MTNMLAAWRELGIRCAVLDPDSMEMRFSNGVVLPVLAFLDKHKLRHTVDPVDGGFAAFGDDEHGYGYYPIKLLTEEEFDAD